MGMFDELVFDCPSCGKPQYVQTKVLNEPSLDVYRVGDKIKSPVIDERYLRYVTWPDIDNCKKCGANFVIDFSDGTFRVEVWDGKEDIFVDGYETDEPLIENSYTARFTEEQAMRYASYRG